jgi:subtilisin family serine protease
MRKFAGVVVALTALTLRAQTTSTLCQAGETNVPGTSIVDLRLIGCGEGFHDNLLWHLDRADSPNGALDARVTRTATGKGAVVYMCDTGVMRDHDEFARPDGSAVIGAIYPAGVGSPTCSSTDPALVPCNGTDNDLLANGHGTATASIVAGRTVGLAPDAKIVAVYMPAVGSNIAGWVSALDAIIRHAWDPATPQFKTGIINMSFVPGFATPPDAKFPAFESKMRQMIDGVDRDGNPNPNGKKFLFLTIAGNYLPGRGTHCDANMSSNLYPAVLGASIDGLITVGGIDETNHIWDRSCRGDAVDILAPAADMLVASAGRHDDYRSGQLIGGYPLNSGTSFSAPYVAGLAALLLEKNANVTPRQLETILKQNASHVANADEVTAGGRVAIFDLAPPPAPPRRRSVLH